jgi:hypothetical protein
MEPPFKSYVLRYAQHIRNENIPIPFQTGARLENDPGNFDIILPNYTLPYESTASHHDDSFVLRLSQAPIDVAQLILPGDLRVDAVVVQEVDALVE